MDLRVSVFLLFVLFARGQSLSCYECTSVSSSCSPMSCPAGLNRCLGAAVTAGNTTLAVKSCTVSTLCPNGSMNFGIGVVSSYCCNTDLCNAQNAPDPSTNTPNGNKCYFCNGQNCMNTVSCKGTEDRCFNATGSFGVQSLVLKGCVSKSICDAKSLIPSVADISCCDGNLCNGAQTFIQSFLFLCLSLLFILIT